MLKIVKQIILFLFIYNLTLAQTEVPVTLRAQFNGSYGYKIIGNTHNEFDNWQDPVPPCLMQTQSSATLNLQPNQNIVKAFLYWSGIGDGTLANDIQLNGINYAPTSLVLGNPEPGGSFFSYFASYLDVTSQVLISGNGLYNFSNMNLNSLMSAYCSNSIYYGGWYLLVIYNEVGLPNNQLNVYDGFNVVSTYFNNGVTNLQIDNLNIVDNLNAKMTYVAWNGSPNLFYNESLFLNGNLLSNALNPIDNPFNGTNTFTGSTTNWNQDIDTFDISNYINIGDTQALLTFNSFFYRFVQTVVTSIRSELPDATAQINQVTGQSICGNRNLVVGYKVANNNSNAVLPANVPVSFYANNTLLQTTNTPASIAIGGFANFITTVSIPLYVPNTFDLRVVVDNSTTNTSTVAESNETNNEATQTITLSDITVTPTFTQITPICSGATFAALPTISLNNISGSWSPALNNLATTTYTFTPNAGQCATTATMTIVVNQSVTPTFTQINPICSGATLTALPTISLNNISGSWSPALNNLATTTYTFTPNAGQCATTATMTIMVNPSITPSFTQITPICNGQTLNALPTISLNNISGSWSPALNNLATTTYTYTPNTGQCATTNTMTIVVNPSVLPDFADVTLCANDTSVSLNNQSPNGIVGTWFPPAIDFSANGFYTFTPNAGQCANSQTITITINQNSISDFDWTLTQPFTNNAVLTINAVPSGNFLYQLDFGPQQSSNIFQNISSGLHSVTVYDTNGCLTSITKNDILVIHYPLFFTPNGDGFNDTWKIDDLVLQPNAPIFIYDRYGKLLKQISTIGSGWDGTING